MNIYCDVNFFVCQLGYINGVSSYDNYASDMDVVVTHFSQ